MRPRIAFWGTSDTAVTALDSLAASGAFEVVAVVTRPDAPVGRHHEMTAPPVKRAAERLGVKTLQPKKISDPEFRDGLAALDLDLSIVVAFGRIIPEPLLAIPKRGTLNLHPSLLPKYRGPTPVQATILAGDDKAGVTIMVLDKEMDHGPILAQREIALDGTETHDALERRLFEIGSEMAVRLMPEYLSGDLKAVEQDHSKAVYCKMIDRDSGKIDFITMDAAAIERMSRAYEPWPGIWGVWKRGERQMRVKLFEVEAAAGALPPGAIVFSGETGRLSIGAASGSLVVRGIQPEGKRRMTVAEFLNGAPADFLLGRFA